MAELRAIDHAIEMGLDNFMVIFYFGAMDKISEFFKLREVFPHLKLVYSDNIYFHHTMTDGKKNDIVLFKQFDDGRVLYDGEIKFEELRKFVRKNFIPKAISFDHRVLNYLIPYGQDLIILIFHNQIIKEVQEIFN